MPKRLGTAAVKPLDMSDLDQQAVPGSNFASLVGSCVFEQLTQVPGSLAKSGGTASVWGLISSERRPSHCGSSGFTWEQEMLGCDGWSYLYSRPRRTLLLFFPLGSFLLWFQPFSVAIHSPLCMLCSVDSVMSDCLQLYGLLHTTDSSIHGICQARILDWAAMPYSRRSPQPRDWTSVSYVSCIGRQILYPLSHLGSPVSLLCLPAIVFVRVSVSLESI